MIKGFILGILVMYVISFFTVDEFSEFYWIYAPLVYFLESLIIIFGWTKAVIHFDSYWYLWKHCGLNPFHIKASDLINLPKEDKKWLYNHARLKSWKENLKNILDKEPRV